MRIVFDQGTPAPLRLALDGHEVSTAFELGWSTLDNGALLAAAEGEFDLIITTDRNLKYQQDLPRRDLAILVLPTATPRGPDGIFTSTQVDELMAVLEQVRAAAIAA